MMEVFVPIVSVETSHAMGKEVERVGEKQYVSEWIRKIGEENPCVCEFLNLYVGDSPDPVRVIACGVMVYAILSNQGHIDKLASVASRTMQVIGMTTAVDDETLKRIGFHLRQYARFKQTIDGKWDTEKQALVDLANTVEQAAQQGG